MDKYQGRQLTKQGFSEAMADFFHDGQEFHTQLLPLFIDKLTSFAAVISKQSHFRFFSSSLLLIHEGNIDWNEYKKPNSSENKNLKPLSSLIDMRFIDFAHTDEVDELGQDVGLLFGVNNLIAILKSLQQPGSVS